MATACAPEMGRVCVGPASGDSIAQWSAPVAPTIRAPGTAFVVRQPNALANGVMWAINVSMLVHVSTAYRADARPRMLSVRSFPAIKPRLVARGSDVDVHGETIGCRGICQDGGKCVCKASFAGPDCSFECPGMLK